MGPGLRARFVPPSWLHYKLVVIHYMLMYHHMMLNNFPFFIINIGLRLSNALQGLKALKLHCTAAIFSAITLLL